MQELNEKTFLQPGISLPQQDIEDLSVGPSSEFTDQKASPEHGTPLLQQEIEENSNHGLQNIEDLSVEPNYEIINQKASPKHGTPLFRPDIEDLEDTSKQGILLLQQEIELLQPEIEDTEDISKHGTLIPQQEIEENPAEPSRPVTNRRETPLTSNTRQTITDHKKSRMTRTFGGNQQAEPSQPVTNRRETPLTLNKLMDYERSCMTNRSRNEHDLPGYDQPTENLAWSSRPGHPRGAGAVDYEKMRIRSPFKQDPIDPDQPTEKFAWSSRPGHPRGAGAVDYEKMRIRSPFNCLDQQTSLVDWGPRTLIILIILTCCPDQQTSLVDWGPGIHRTNCLDQQTSLVDWGQKSLFIHDILTNCLDQQTSLVDWGPRTIIILIILTR